MDAPRDPTSRAIPARVSSVPGSLPPGFADCAEVLARRAHPAALRSVDAILAHYAPEGFLPLALSPGVIGLELVGVAPDGSVLRVNNTTKGAIFPAEPDWRYGWHYSRVLGVLAPLRESLDAADRLPLDGLPPEWTPFAALDQLPGRVPLSPAVVVRQGNRFRAWDGAELVSLPRHWRWLGFFREWVG